MAWMKTISTYLVIIRIERDQVDITISYMWLYFVDVNHSSFIVAPVETLRIFRSRPVVLSRVVEYTKLKEEG